MLLKIIRKIDVLRVMPGNLVVWITSMERLVVGLLLCISASSGITGRDEQLRVAEGTGQEAKIRDAPFTVALVKTSTSYSSASPFCTGSIIDPEWVLTAAHCVESFSLPRLISIVAGADQLSQFAGSDVQIRRAKEFKTHPKYWANRPSKYDVAVVRVEDQFKFNERVNKANLWNKEWVKAPPKAKVEYGSQDCRAYGWGWTAKGAPSSTLRTTEILAVHGTKACLCFKMYEQRRLMCSLKGAGYLCQGDSGGPLVCEDDTVVGVAHIIYHRAKCSLVFFGKIEIDCNNKDFLSAWMYVCPMLGFIHEHVPSAPEQPKSCLSPPLHMPTILQSLLCLVIAFV